MQVLRAPRAGGIAPAVPLRANIPAVPLPRNAPAGPLRGKGGAQARGGLNALCGRPDRGRRPELGSQAAREFRRGGYRRLHLDPPIRRELAVREGCELTVGHPCHAG
jgi:hypothetical protein